MTVYKGFASERHNVIADILAKFADVDPTKLHESETKAKFYQAMEETPFAAMVVFLAEAMDDLGYEVTLAQKQ
jgi:hypothetical protein